MARETAEDEAVPSSDLVRKRTPERTFDLDMAIDVAVDLLRKHGESGFRLKDLQQMTGVSTSALYRAFGSRDGILAAAFSKIFKGYVNESIEVMAAVVQQSNSPGDLRAGLRAATIFVADPQRFDHRLDRAAIIAGVRGRPEFRESLNQTQTELTNAIADLIEEAASRGLVNLKSSARVGAQFIQAVTLGRVIAELEDADDEASRDEWVALMCNLLDHMLFDGLLDA